MKHTHISAQHRLFSLNLRDVWQYRELILLFVKRSFQVSYKQTILGPLWLFIRPLMTALFDVLLFGSIAKLSTDGVPQLLFYLSGNALWSFFSGRVSSNSGTFTENVGLFSRITAHTEGDIDIWGRISSLLEIGTGFHRELTGLENIYMNGAILGMTRAEIDAKMDQIIAFSEIEDFIDTPVKRYSSGMFVKLGFAVAAFLDSEILVMDEALAVGDMAFQKKCLDKMRQSADEEGKTILYVSHNMDTIRRLCERCIVLHQGKILFDGDVERAIALYMNSNIAENPVDLSLRGKSVGMEKVLKLEHLELLDKVTPVYQPEETLNLLLTVNALEPVADVSLRLTFRTETDVGIGTAWSQPFSLPRAGKWQLNFAFPLSQLAQGKLFVSLGIYRTDEIGRKLSLSHVTRAFQIELQGPPVWDTTAHGYVHFSEIQVRGMSRTQDAI